MLNLGDWSVHEKSCTTLWAERTPAEVGVQPRSFSVSTALLFPASAVGKGEMAGVCLSCFCLVHWFSCSSPVSDFPIWSRKDCPRSLNLTLLLSSHKGAAKLHSHHKALKAVQSAVTGDTLCKLKSLWKMQEHPCSLIHSSNLCISEQAAWNHKLQI